MKEAFYSIKYSVSLKSCKHFYHLTWQRYKGDLKAPAESAVFAGGGPESAEQLGMETAETEHRCTDGARIFDCGKKAAKKSPHSLIFSWKSN